MSPTDGPDHSDAATDSNLAFFGAITASVTHELNNILGTIDQMSGLLEDLALTVQEGTAISDEQLNSLAGRISGQADRGTALIKRLNTFSHTCDHATAECDLYELVENLAALTERLARRHRSHIEVIQPTEEIRFVTRPFLVMQVIFLSLQSVLSLVKRDSEITILLHSGPGEAIIEIVVQPDDPSVDYSIGDALALTAERLAARMSSHITDGHIHIEVGIPAPVA